MTNSTTSPSIFCAITHGLYEPWIDILYNGQVPTWLSNKRISEFSMNHFHGIPGGSLIMGIDRLHEKIRWQNRWVATPLRIVDGIVGLPLRSYIPNCEISKRLLLDDPVIQINFIDMYATMKWKDISTLEYFLTNSDADFLFMTTTSSYVRPAKLLELVSNLPKRGVYAGAIEYSGAKFAAGNNRLFSRDVASAIVSARDKLACGTIEDLAIGNLCSILGFNLVQLPKINISSMEELENLSDRDIESNFHFRLKSGTLKERNDVLIMKRLHERVRRIDES